MKRLVSVSSFSTSAKAGEQNLKLRHSSLCMKLHRVSLTDHIISPSTFIFSLRATVYFDVKPLPKLLYSWTLKNLSISVGPLFQPPSAGNIHVPGCRLFRVGRKRPTTDCSALTGPSPSFVSPTKPSVYLEVNIDARGQCLDNDTVAVLHRHCVLRQGRQHHDVQQTSGENLAAALKLE